MMPAAAGSHPTSLMSPPNRGMHREFDTGILPASNYRHQFLRRLSLLLWVLTPCPAGAGESAARKESSMGEAGKTFGACCEKLKEALEASEFEPMITVAPNEIIYLCIGLQPRGNWAGARRPSAVLLSLLRYEAADRGKSEPRPGLTAKAKKAAAKVKQSGGNLNLAKVYRTGLWNVARGIANYSLGRKRRWQMRSCYS
jgi:hypothetical protein